MKIGICIDGQEDFPGMQATIARLMDERIKGKKREADDPVIPVSIGLPDGILSSGSTKSLPIGDFWYIDMDTKRVLRIDEHKQPSDLQSSLFNGHLDEQLARMRCRDAVPDDVEQLALVLTGDHGPLDDNVRKMVTTRCLKMAQGSNPIQLVRLQSPLELAHYMKKTAEYLREAPVRDSPRGALIEEIVISARKRRLCVADRYLAFVEATTRVGKERAIAICNAFPTMELLRQSLEKDGGKELIEVKSGKTRTPKVSAKELYDLMCTEEDYNGYEDNDDDGEVDESIPVPKVALTPCTDCGPPPTKRMRV